MEEFEVEKLLRKYWDGETSIEEERLLRKYWNLNPNAAADEGISDYMVALAQAKTISLQKRFTFSSRPYHIQSLLKWSGIAAALVFGISFCTLWFNHYRSQQHLLVMHNEVEADLMSMSKMLNQAYNESLDLNATPKIKAD